MKGSIFVDGRLYLFNGGTEENKVVQILTPTGKPVATFPSWKRNQGEVWHDETIEETTRSKLFTAIEGLRRVSKAAGAAVLFP